MFWIKSTQFIQCSLDIIKYFCYILIKLFKVVSYNMATMNVNYDNLVVGTQYIVTYYSNSLRRNATFTGKYNGEQYGNLIFLNTVGPDEYMTSNGLPRNRIVSIQVYTNPQLPGGINQQINSYGGKRNRRKYKRSGKYIKNNRKQTKNRRTYTASR